MLKYDKLYVGKYWVEEYGDPNDPKYRDYLLSLRIHGINDDRVHPAHALKYVVKLEN